jgi:membrane protein CcdC involved in cytochrome C biogenesis
VLRESFAIGFVFSILLVRAEQSGLEGGESLRFRGGFGLLFRVDFGILIPVRGVVVLKVHFEFRIRVTGIWSS